MDMETEKRIDAIFNSVNGITKISPDDALFLKIQRKIRSSNVPPKTVWMVAASIAALLILNFWVINTKSKTRTESTSSYLEMTLNQNNQLY